MYNFHHANDVLSESLPELLSANSPHYFAHGRLRMSSSPPPVPPSCRSQGPSFPPPTALDGRLPAPPRPTSVAANQWEAVWRGRDHSSLNEPRGY